MNPEEISPSDGVQSENVESVDVAAPAKEENPVDEKIRRVLGSENVLPAEDEESEGETEEEKPSEKQNPVKETPKPTEKPAEKPKSNVEEAQPEKKVSRIDRRLASKYLENEILSGKDADTLPSLEEVIDSISGYSLKEKETALHNVLRQNRAFRNPQQGGDDNVSLSDEDVDALAEAKAEERFQEMQGEILERERRNDLIATLEAHPELDARTKEHNPKIEAAVEKLYDRGMKASEAYALVMESIAEASEATKRADDRKKQASLSGLLSGGSKTVQSEMTEEEIERMQTENPSKFMQLLKDGKLKNWGENN